MYRRSYLIWPPAILQLPSRHHTQARWSPSQPPKTQNHRNRRTSSPSVPTRRGSQLLDLRTVKIRQNQPGLFTGWAQPRGSGLVTQPNPTHDKLTPPDPTPAGVGLRLVNSPENNGRCRQYPVSGGIPHYYGGP